MRPALSFWVPSLATPEVVAESTQRYGLQSRALCKGDRARPAAQPLRGYRYPLDLRATLGTSSCVVGYSRAPALVRKVGTPRVCPTFPHDASHSQRISSTGEVVRHASEIIFSDLICSTRAELFPRILTRRSRENAFRIPSFVFGNQDFRVWRPNFPLSASTFRPHPRRRRARPPELTGDTPQPVGATSA